MTRTKAYKRHGKLLLPEFKPPVSKIPEPTLEEISVNSAQCEKAVKALVAHLEKTKASKEDTELLSKDEHMYLVVTLKQMSGRDQIKPIRLALPHPLIDPKKSPVCLFVKDPQREYKDLLQEKNISFISRVVGVEKLKGKFKPFEARRQLMSEYDMFLADDRILPLLPKLLGRQWIETKKQPLPISIKRADLKAELERVLSSTPLILNRGTCLTIKFGTPIDQHTAEQLSANMLAIIPQLAVRLPLGGWKNVQALHIKSSTSASLPIWNCELSARFDVERRLTGQEKKDDEVDEAVQDAEEADKIPDFVQKKGKKRKNVVVEAGEQKEDQGIQQKKRRKST